MTLTKTHLITFAVGLILGLVTGFFVGKGMYNQPIEESVTRDTIIVTDTIPQYYPKPIEVEKVRTEYKWLAKVMTDTVVKTDVITCHDSVLVEVPIESKHYGNNQYDAWISGYYPTLDSIKVYQKTEYITETITKTRRKPWGIGLNVGYGYDFKSKTAAPFVGVGISYDIISF